MPREPWENDLLMEFEGLDYLARLLQKADDLIEEGLTSFSASLDPNLVMLIEALRYDLNLALSGGVKLDDGTYIPGVLKQLEDVHDEVVTLQAGKPTKGGVPDEEDSADK